MPVPACTEIGLNAVNVTRSVSIGIEPDTTGIGALALTTIPNCTDAVCRVGDELSSIVTV